MMMFTDRQRRCGTRPARAPGRLCTAPGREVAWLDPSHQGVSVAISMHSASVPIFLRMLGNMNTWLVKAEAHASAKKFDPSVYIGARLAPDMLPFVNQVQIACDAAKACVARLAGVEAPKFEDNETSIAELRERIRKTVDYVGSVPADSI